jgi:hypothetical protein
MSDRMFQMLVALIARKAAQWSHELLVVPERDWSIETRRRFCAALRAVLDQIEAGE